jgi:hypothetical protein
MVDSNLKKGKKGIDNNIFRQYFGSSAKNNCWRTN